MQSFMELDHIYFATAKNYDHNSSTSVEAEKGNFHNSVLQSNSPAVKQLTLHSEMK